SCWRGNNGNARTRKRFTGFCIGEVLTARGRCVGDRRNTVTASYDRPRRQGSEIASNVMNYHVNPKGQRRERTAVRSASDNSNHRLRTAVLRDRVGGRGHRERQREFR